MILGMTKFKQDVSRHDGGSTSAAGTAIAPAVVDGQWMLQTVLPLLFAGSVVYAIATATIGWGNTLNDRHSFRQSQAATTALFLIDQPFRLAYETPVLGKPWSIPMEFPLYQWIVARLVGVFGTPLDQTGRFVSLVFFLLTTVPLHRLVRAMGVSPPFAWVPLIMFIVSPFYIFWSRTFMIESTALFFSVAYLAAVIEASSRGGWKVICLAVGLGTIASLVKVTTFIPFLACAGAVAGARLWRKWTAGGVPSPWRIDAAKVAAILGVPFLAAVVWVRFSDAIKAENPLAAAHLLSSTSASWNYGTLDQKLSGSVWAVIIGRFYELFGLPQLAWLLLGAALAVTLVHRRRWRETTACFAAWISAPAIFTNLHFVHDYYANANGIFLIAAIGFALVGLLEDAGTRLAGVVLTTVALIAALSGHAALYLPRQAANSAEVLEAAEYIKAATPEDSVIICLSNDWSPLVSYYARRRSLNIPMDGEGRMPQSLVAEAFERLRGEKIGAVVLVEPVAYPLEVALRQLRDVGIEAPVLTVKNLPKF